MAGVIAVVALSFSLSLMFPTIYGVALKGLGPATKFGAAGLVMAIVGGAVMPLLQGALVDSTSAALLLAAGGCGAEEVVSWWTAGSEARPGSFWSAPVLLSVTHGESMSPAFQEGFYDAVSTYIRTRDPDAFVADLENAVSQGRIPPR